jgi:hypothetical protein
VRTLESLEVTVPPTPPILTPRAARVLATIIERAADRRRHEAKS